MIPLINLPDLQLDLNNACKCIYNTLFTSSNFYSVSGPNIRIIAIREIASRKT